ncbi:hypothetical protein COE43_12430 [Bacillus cereus]|nr:hypothetical protein COE43_12430 [Bacillus cereus]
MIKKILDKYKLEQDLHILESKKEDLVKEIKKGKYKFTDDNRIIEFCNLLTEKLKKSYTINGELTTFEIELLDKAIKDGIYDISFFLLSQLKEDGKKEKITKQLISEGFQLVEDVGYINIAKRVPHIIIDNE